jgi:hypothetical protein
LGETVTWQWVTVILGLAFLTFAFFGFALVVIGRTPTPDRHKDPSTEDTQIIRPPEKKGDER